MKTIIKLVVALVLLNAAARGGKVAFDYFQLKDSMQRLLTFGSQTPTRVLREGILAKATELHLPVLPQDVAVHRQGVRTTADVRYTQPVELFPRYVYSMELAMTVDVVSLYAGVPDDPPQ